MNRVFEIWENSLYTDPVLFIVQIFTFIISIKKFKSSPQLKLIPLYLILFISFSAINTIMLSHPSSKNKIGEIKFEIIGNFTVTFFEFSAFAHYAYVISKNKAFRKAILLLSFIALTMAILLISFPFHASQLITVNTLNNIYIIESILLLIICSFYFIELFSAPAILKLLKTTNFWVSSGLIFYLACTLPFTVLSNYFIQTNVALYKNLYSLIYIFYILLFVMITRGYYAER